MPSANNLKDVYIEEMRDLWSANDQMQRVMQSLSDKASDGKLKEMLAQSVSGIGQHTAALKSILEAQGGNVGKDHCKGMEGLVAEAKKHAIDTEFWRSAPRPRDHRAVSADVPLRSSRLRHGSGLCRCAGDERRCREIEVDRERHLQGG